MGYFSELHAEQPEDSDMLFAMEEQAYHEAIGVVAGFVESGSVSIDRALADIKERLNGN